jgi:hypothetical protein
VTPYASGFKLKIIITITITITIAIKLRKQIIRLNKIYTMLEVQPNLLAQRRFYHISADDIVKFYYK